MYKLMIVEDEAFVRFGLENAIDWEKYQIQIVATAQNGKEALKLYHQYHPHLMITDLKMPVMDGLALIEEIRKTDKEMKVIILTCMEDFNMARQAIQYAVSYYLTKYDINIEDLRDKIVDLCRTIPTDTAVPAQAMAQEKRLRSQEWADYFYGQQEQTQDDFTAMIEANQILEGDQYVLVCLVLNTLEQSQTTESYLQNMVTEITKPQKRCQLLAVKENELVLLYTQSAQPQEKQYDAVLSEVKHLMKMLETYVEVTSSAFIGLFFTELIRLKEEFQWICKQKYLTYYLKEEAVFLLKNSYESQIRREVSCHVEAVKQQYQQLFGEEYTADFFSYAKKFDYVLLADINAVGNLIVGWMQLFWVLAHLLDEISPQDMAAFAQTVLSADEFLKAIDVLPEVMRQSKEEKEQKISFEMLKAISYIQNNLSQDVSLSMVAEYVNFSTGYLSYLFKHELNMNFTEFILKLRIKKAKLMLSQTDKKLYEIAQELGWYDPSYFIKVFKRLVGETPNAYRKTHRTGGAGNRENFVIEETEP